MKVVGLMRMVLSSGGHKIKSNMSFLYALKPPKEWINDILIGKRFRVLKNWRSDIFEAGKGYP